MAEQQGSAPKGAYQLGCLNNSSCEAPEKDKL